MESAVELLGERALRPLKRSEYERLAGAGAFSEEKVELVEGVILRMSPQGVAHASCLQRLTRLLIRAFAERADVRIQSSFPVSDETVLEPDAALVPHDPRDYADQPPERALLVIEVAESSLRFDRKYKARQYAAAGVPEYWVVNLAERVIEVHVGPGGEGYGAVTVAKAGERIRLVAFPGDEVGVDDVLPPA